MKKSGNKSTDEKPGTISLRVLLSPFENPFRSMLFESLWEVFCRKRVFAMFTFKSGCSRFSRDRDGDIAFHEQNSIVPHSVAILGLRQAFQISKVQSSSFHYDDDKAWRKWKRQIACEKRDSLLSPFNFTEIFMRGISSMKNDIKKERKEKCERGRKASERREKRERRRCWNDGYPRETHSLVVLCVLKKELIAANPLLPL